MKKAKRRSRHPDDGFDESKWKAGEFPLSGIGPFVERDERWDNFYVPDNATALFSAVSYQSYDRRDYSLICNTI